MGCKCCPCCRRWTAIEERMGREYVQEKAESLPCSCCCGPCYDRRCVKASYIVFAILMVGALFMSNVGVMGLIAYSKAGSFQPAKCTVVSSVYTGQQFKCGRGSCPAGVNCATYPCLLVKVTYTPTGGSTREVPLYDSQHELFARGESKICSIQLEGCNSNSNPSQEVSNYENKYGVVGQIFDCRYNPGDLGQVIQHRAKPRPFSLALAGASGLLFIVGLVGLLVTALSCGCPCKVMCSGRPPAVIREKLGTHGGNK